MRSFFQEGLGVLDDFWTMRIVECSTYLRWYCCPHADQKCVAETWIEKGDVLSSHYCVNYSFDLILELAFALNREFLAPPKWRVYYARRFRWFPRGFEECIAEMTLVNSYSESDVKRRMDAARRIWLELLEKVETEIRLTTDTIARYYVEKILGQK